MTSESNKQHHKEDLIEENHVLQAIFRYLGYWYLFLIFGLLAYGIAKIYLKYTPNIYQSEARIKVLNPSEGLEVPTSAFVFKRSTIKLQNETYTLLSYPIIKKVVDSFNFNYRFYEKGRFLTSELADLPFSLKQKISNEELVTNKSYEVSFSDDGSLTIQDIKKDLNFVFNNFQTTTQSNELPFEINISDSDSIAKLKGREFIIRIGTLFTTTNVVKNTMEIKPIGENSDLLTVSYKGESIIRNQRIIDAAIDEYKNEGIRDRRKVSENTIAFIDNRFKFLSKELDSVELSEQSYKNDNDLVDIKQEASIELNKESAVIDQLDNLNTQLYLVKAMTDQVNEQLIGVKSLPANLLNDHPVIYGLINNYNSHIRTLEKLKLSAGENNPGVINQVTTIQNIQADIKQALASLRQKLEYKEQQLNSKLNKVSRNVGGFPQKDKQLRAIERTQKIKESLYLLLLQKREEAAINRAITEPSIKVIEPALTSLGPVSPNKRIILISAVLLGLFIPFLFLFLRFSLDTKIHDKKDLTSILPEIPFMGEIPFVKDKIASLFENPNDRSPVAESFRILSSNVNYLLAASKDVKKDEGKVIYCTSTTKGEGKTYISINLSLALSTLNNKVLLIGGDLRNPQIHNYTDTDKNVFGLSNYLYDSSVNWQDFLLKGFEKHENHDILLSGTIPPNPSQMLTNGNFEKLLSEARKIYDYVVIDTAPTILVTDTMLISKYADATIYLTRSNYTEKQILSFPKELFETKKLKNMSLVINGIGHKKKKGYGYKYGYKYGYGYGYNYGYGYGYGNENDD